MTPSPVHLDFVRDRRHQTLLGAALLGVAVAAGAALLVWFAALEAALEDAEQRSTADTRRALPAPMAAATLDTEEANKLVAGLRQLTAPWEDLLGAVESAATGDVAVLSLQQDAAQSSLKFVAEARNAPAMLEYLRRLGKDRRIASATIESHRIDQQQPEQPVRFSVTARYAAQQP